jgi:hypothetical protein
MGYRGKIGWGILYTVMLAGIADQAVAEQREPLIVTPLPEADPATAAVTQPRLIFTRLQGSDQQAPDADQAIESFSRVISQARLAEQQAIETRCRTARPTADNAADRFAWAVNCRYARH